MAQVFLGSDLLSHRGSLDELPKELFDLIDSEGINVVESVQRVLNYYRCTCLLKLVDDNEPFSAYITFPKAVYDEIVGELDISQIGVIH